MPASMDVLELLTGITVVAPEPPSRGLKERRKTGGLGGEGVAPVERHAAALLARRRIAGPYEQVLALDRDARAASEVTVP
jgi:hypothetical protein